MMSNLNTSPLSRPQGDALVALVCAMRPDWEAPGVVTGIRAATGKGAALDVIRASIEAAALTTNRTPAVIGMAGPHWSTRTSGHMPASPTERCPIEFHTGLAHNCPQCRAEQIAVDVDNGEAKRTPVQDVASAEYVRALREHVERGGDVTTFRSSLHGGSVVTSWSPTAGLPDEPEAEPVRRWDDD